MNSEKLAICELSKNKCTYSGSHNVSKGKQKNDGSQRHYIHMHHVHHLAALET